MLATFMRICHFNLHRSALCELEQCETLTWYPEMADIETFQQNVGVRLSDTLLIHDTCVGPTANKVTSRRPIYAPKARGE